jgi:hypothetical protein
MKRREWKDRPTSITGNLMPVYKEELPGLCRPVLIEIEDTEFVPIFSTVEKLYKAMQFIGKEGQYKIKQIDDGELFLEEVLPHYRIARDVRMENGKVRWTEIKGEPC